MRKAFSLFGFGDDLVDQRGVASILFRIGEGLQNLAVVDEFIRPVRRGVVLDLFFFLWLLS